LSNYDLVEMMSQAYKSWPFVEATALIRRFPEPPQAPVVFETGYGPSGLPHIGTFAEVARTSWVRHAFETLTGWHTRLIAFSDDKDGLRKVPLNVPQPEMLATHLGKPLSHIPDPFGAAESYSAHMNRKLQDFLDFYGFDYEFQSATEAYSRGDFDEGLTILLREVEQVRAIILPTLREEKRAGWSPFFPVCEACGRVYSTRVVGYDPGNNTIAYVCDQPVGPIPGCGQRANISVLGGRVKVGWKVDWALRWYAYDVAYEMYGKDLIESARLSAKIVRLMGKQPPNGFFYEMLLDEEGHKISKSVGQGISVDAWVRYAPLPSLLHYLFQNPRRAKRLTWDIVPKSVDDYLAELRRYPSVDSMAQRDLAVWHIARGANVPDYQAAINFSLINNLVAGLGTDHVDLIQGYLERYDPLASDYRVFIRDLIEKSINYYRDFVVPHKQYRSPTGQEQRWLAELRDRVRAHPNEDEKELQAIPFEVARAFDVSPNQLFRAFYEVLLGQERGPRFGTFARLVGKDRVVAMLAAVLDS
jgi:lysyl-tRNA synthetase, class I